MSKITRTVSGHPYSATLIGESDVSSPQEVVLVCVKPRYDASNILYKFNAQSIPLSVAHIASTVNATLISITADAEGHSTIDTYDELMDHAESLVKDFLLTLNAIENSDWNDI
jgi:hypothetical protein